MVKNHLKRINAPKTWPIARKSTVFVQRPRPGAHGLAHAVPMAILFKDMLGVARTSRGVRYILNSQEVLVNGKRRRRPDDLAGLFDVITFQATKASYRIVLNRLNQLQAIPVAGQEAALLPCRIESKTALPGAKIQLGFHNGKTLLVQKKGYKVGDTLLLSLDDKEQGHFPLATGAFAVITGGKHVGVAGTVEKIDEGKVLLKGADGVVETRKRHLFVLGTGKAAIKLA